jgi:hypothetical protein
MPLPRSPKPEATKLPEGEVAVAERPKRKANATRQQQEKTRDLVDEAWRLGKLYGNIRLSSDE